MPELHSQPVSAAPLRQKNKTKHLKVLMGRDKNTLKLLENMFE